MPLIVLNGHGALVSGTYKHALGMVTFNSVHNNDTICVTAMEKVLTRTVLTFYITTLVCLNV